MTAAQSGDELREAIAEALTRSGRLMFDGDRYRAADAVLPMVTVWAERQAQQRAAEELEAAAEAMVTKPHPCLAIGGWLRARAATLTADDRAGA